MKSFYSWPRLWPILFLASIFFLSFLSRVILAPLLPNIEKELWLSHGQAGQLFLIITVGYFIAMMGSGFVAAKIGHRRTITISACGVGLTLLFLVFAKDLLWLRITVFSVGIASGLYLSSGITTITHMVPIQDWGKAISIHEVAPNFGFVAAPLLAEILLLHFSWQAAPAMIAGISILIGIVFYFFGKGGDFKGNPPNFSALKALFVTREFWIMILLFGLAISSTIGMYTMLPLYLVTEIGLKQTIANSIVSLSRLLGLISSLISGWAADRFGPKRTMMFMLCVTGISTILLGFFSRPEAVIIMVFVQAALSTCFFPSGFSVLSSIGPSKYRNVAVSYVIPSAFIFGGGIVPTVIGISGDAGTFSTGIIMVGGLIVSGGFLAGLVFRKIG